MRFLLQSLALCTLVVVTSGLAPSFEGTNEAGEVSRARQGPRRLARSEVASLAAHSHSPVDVKEEELIETTSSSASSRKRKRCYYVGTFFHRIDCNAPANSTSIPYSRRPEPTANAV